MNILVYIPSLDQSWGGIRQYSIALIKILIQDERNKYFIYHNSQDPEVISLVQATLGVTLVQDSDVRLVTWQKRLERGKRAVNLVSRRLGNSLPFELMSLIDRITERYGIEVVHCPYQFIPATTKAKLVVTLHDVQEMHFPDFFTAEERAYRAVHYLDYLRRADKVVVSYNHVKVDLVTYFAVDPTAIHVILLDMGKLWFERYTTSDVFPIAELALTTPFVFYPANTWKHKNHLRLLQALALLRDEHACVVNMVCTGHITAYYHEVLVPEIARLGLAAQVTFMGVVDEQVLFSLYRQCLGVVVPTIYEAGSFPLMESILLQVPVVCSNVTSLPETVDNPAFVFDPLDVNSIAAKVGQLWDSEEYRQHSMTNSVRMAPRIRHTRALEKFQALYASF